MVIFGDQINGPFFITGNLKGETYLEFLQDAFEPAIKHAFELIIIITINPTLQIG